MTKREVRRTTQFRRDLRKAHKQGRDISVLNKIITTLANDELLPDKHNDHALSGNWKGYRECHVAPDWLLVYQKLDIGVLLLVLTRLSSHNELDF